jgi:hypothetical protein
MNAPQVVKDFSLLTTSCVDPDFFSVEVYTDEQRTDLFMSVTEWQDDPEKLTLEFYKSKDKEYWQIGYDQFSELMKAVQQRLKAR